MIGSPDLLAFTADTDFREPPADPLALPEELSVPLCPYSGDSSPWSRTSEAKFVKDFVLISEFSEQVGPQPLLTIPDETKACGSFDLNHFSLRIMSVDYQTSFTGPGGSSSPKLNFVEDSKVVLGDSREGAYAYVHHLTLYDLEARGFVRPFCMAYVSSQEEKIMSHFPRLLADFSKASECLKTGNRKNFANELYKRLGDLEYTRLVLLREMRRERLSNFPAGHINGDGGERMSGGCPWDGEKEGEKGNGRLPPTAGEGKLKDKDRCEPSIEEVKKRNDASGSEQMEKGSSVALSNEGEEGECNGSEGCERPKQKQTEEVRSARSRRPDKAAELAGVEKAIQDHRSLLKQVTSYPTRKLRDPEFLPYEPDDAPHCLEPDLDPYALPSQIPEPGEECGIFAHTSSHTPQLISSSSCRQFDKRLKNLEELCDEYFLQQALKQLRTIERSFRGDTSYLFTHQLTQNLLQHLKTTNFLFEEPCDLVGEAERRFDRPEHRPSPLLPLSPLQSEPMSPESYTSCVEMVPIKLGVGVNGHPPAEFTSVPVSPCCDDLPLTSDAPVEGDHEDKVPTAMKDSISSGESIEVLGTEKSFRTQGSQGTRVVMETVAQRPPSFPLPVLEGRKWRATTQRANSEDSIEVLSTTESIILDDLRASGISAIHEETAECDREETDSPEGKDACALACIHGAGDKETEKCNDFQSTPGTPETPTIVLTPPEPCVNFALNKVNYLDSRTTAGPLFPVADAGSLQEGPWQLVRDDSSDCTSYLSLTSTATEFTPSPGPHGTRWSASGGRRRRARLGRAALRFLRQFPFAVHAVYSLLSGRTLVVLGSEESVVRRWVTALAIYTPHVGNYRESIQPWMSDPLQITDLLTWKLIGFNRMASPTSPSTPPSVVRYSRYLSVLDVDQGTLRCPAYRGALICPLVEPKTQIVHGTTYYLYAQSVIGKLVSRAFLLTFSHGVRFPGSPSERGKVERCVGDLHDDDMNILRFLSELVMLRLTDAAPRVLRFSYAASTVFKL